MVVLPHNAHPSAHTPNPSPSLNLFPISTANLFFPLAIHLPPQLIPSLPHHSDASHIYLLPLAFPASAPNHQSSPSALLIQQIIIQISNAHTANLIHIPSDIPASSAKQQAVVAGSQSKSPSSTVTDYPYRVAKPHTRSKWNAKNYLTVNVEKTLS